MNKKEISEIRRRFHPEKNNITALRGCYVNEKREIVTEFCRSVQSLPTEEAERYMAILKRTLSGTQGKNLSDIVFRPDQVMEGKEHKLLMALRDGALRDEESVHAFYQRVIESLEIEGNYLILLAHDAYDVFKKPKDDSYSDRESEEVFQYILCSICPVKPGKPGLSYFAEENDFRNRMPDWFVGAPELGFLFPTFDDRAANIYNALYYTRDAAEGHEELVSALFGAEIMPADAQREVFEAVLEETLEEDLRYEVVQAVHEWMRERIEEQKADKTAEAPTVSKREVGEILKSCGVSEARIEAFGERYDEEFGKGMELNAQSIVNPKQFELKTPEAMIRVDPERSDSIHTRVIDGVKYILIRADEGVAVNGVNIRISNG